MNVRPVIHTRQVYRVGALTLQELQEKHHFLYDAEIYSTEAGGQRRVYRLTFPNLTLAVAFANQAFDPGAHDDVWFASQPTVLWDERVSLWVRTYAVDQMSFGALSDSSADDGRGQSVSDLFDEEPVY